MKSSSRVLWAALCAAVALAGAALTGMAADSGATRYRGLVFEDRNANGIRDPDEPGVGGTMVSDGRHVVKTDRDGRFELPGFEKTRFIQVTVPDGYEIARHYLRVNSDRSDYSFGLVRRPGAADGSARFVLITDTHVDSPGGIEKWGVGPWIEDLKRFLGHQQIDFLAVTGDLAEEKGIAYHARNVNRETMGVPVYYTLGNHETVRKGDYGEALWEENFGPVYYSFQAGGTHFVALPMLHAFVTPASYTGRERDIETWLANDLTMLPAGMPVVVLAHDLWSAGQPFVTESGGPPQLKFPAGINLRAWFYGHWHINYVRRHGAAKALSACTAPPNKGGGDNSPAAFRIVTVDREGNVDMSLRYPGVATRAVVVAPDPLGAVRGPDGYVTVAVNVYDAGAPTRRVRFAVVSQDRAPQWNDLTAVTDWAWHGQWRPEGAPPGSERVLHVEAELADGEVVRREHAFRMADREVGLGLDPAGEWSNLRGNAAHDAEGPAGYAAELTHLWTANAGAHIFKASPLIVSGQVFVAMVDDDNARRAGVAAFDAVSGRLLWRFSTRNSIRNTIGYAAGRVLAADMEGFVYALDAADGRLVWEERLPLNDVNGYLAGRLSEGLVTDAGVLYVGKGHGLFALNATDGTVRWRNAAWSAPQANTATMTVGDGVLVSSSRWNGLHGQCADTGELLWQHDRRTADGAATFRDGQFFLATRHNLLVLDARSGEVVRDVEHPLKLRAASAPLVTDDLVVIGTAESGWVAFDRNTLKRAWTFEPGPALIVTVDYSPAGSRMVDASLVRAGDIAYGGASDGWFYALDIRTGACLWKKNLGAPVLTTPAMVGNMLFVADFSGNIHGFRRERSEP